MVERAFEKQTAFCQVISIDQCLEYTCTLYVVNQKTHAPKTSKQVNVVSIPYRYSEIWIGCIS